MATILAVIALTVCQSQKPEDVLRPDDIAIRARPIVEAKLYLRVVQEFQYTKRDDNVQNIVIRLCKRFPDSSLGRFFRVGICP